jgi:hypothetical protein
MIDIHIAPGNGASPGRNHVVLENDIRLLFDGLDDEAIAAIDNLIEALLEVRGKTLARIANG